MRSKIQWVEEGERSTKYFIGLEKSKQKSKSLTKIMSDDNKELRKQSDISSETVRFYQRLFSSRNPNVENIKIYLNGASLDKIPENLCNNINDKLQIWELDGALKNFKNNKSPGMDGLSAEFYKKFWDILKPTLFKVYEEAVETGRLTPTQKTGVITLLPKPDKDHTLLKNWRPITLLNIDYKIFTHVIKNRLKVTIPYLINSAQTGYQKGKSTNDNLILMYLVLEYFERNPEKEGYLMQIDFEKAFDSVEHAFLYETLRIMGIGEYLIRLIKVAFTECMSMVLINGHLSKYVYLGRGLHQGSPLSPILFLIVGQVLYKKCEHNERIIGLDIDGINVLLSMFADDTDAFLSACPEVVLELMNELENFGVMSGCKSNKDKTIVVALGASQTNIQNQNIIENAIGAQIFKKEFSALGISFKNNNLDKVIEKNYQDKLEKS